MGREAALARLLRVVDAAGRAAADTPTVLVVDDVHWGDRPSLLVGTGCCDGRRSSGCGWWRLHPPERAADSADRPITRSR